MQAGKTPEIFEEQFVGIEKSRQKVCRQINKFRRIGNTSAIRQRQEQQAGTTGRNERIEAKSRSKKLKPKVGVKVGAKS